MSIIALFCEIDDFFLAYEAWKPATHCLPEATPTETRGHPRNLYQGLSRLFRWHEIPIAWIL